MKTCKSCGCVKALTEFYAGHVCKSCTCKKNKEYRTKVGYKRPRRSSTPTDNTRRHIYSNQYKAQSDVAYAIKVGKLSKSCCEVCGKTEHIHAHHDDYSKPLQVKWLCPKHHSEWHSTNGDGINK